MVTGEDALLEFLRQLKSRNYDFTCVTPATHERILSRPADAEMTLRDIFGWNRSFDAGDLAPELLDLVQQANCVSISKGRLRSLVRVATIGEHLFLHSSYPTTSTDAVFFGPDTYRFVKFMTARLAALDQPGWIVDMGAGSGAAGILAAGVLPSARLSLVDINPEAAKLAKINAKFAKTLAEIVTGDAVPQGCDLVVANPPYIMDRRHRTYRDGGGLLGGEVALQWVRQALAALSPGGTMLLYTGAAVVRGRTRLVEELGALCRAAFAEIQVEEIDPDVFGEELAGEDYCEVERIAVIGVSIKSSEGKEP